MSAEDVAWATPRRRPQPINTFLEPMRSTGAARDVPRTYVHCAKNPRDVFAQFAERARQSPGWTLHVLDTGHHLQYTMPRETAEILLGVRSPVTGQSNGACRCYKQSRAVVRAVLDPIRFS